MKKLSVTGSTLKIAAILIMLIDHIGSAIIGPLRYALPESMADTTALLRNIYQPMRNIGRLAFPIFCFLLVEGFIHTRNVKKYAGRMLLFALISEIPFDFALKGGLIKPGFQNVYFTLLIGLLIMMVFDYFEKKTPRSWTERILCTIIPAAAGIGGLYLSKFLRTDYSFKGVFLIMLLYFFRDNRRTQSVFGAIGISWESWAPLAFIPVWLYNGKRGRQMKYFFYWFYPGHLLILGLLRTWLGI